jgi:hypothetical protein
MPTDETQPQPPAVRPPEAPCPSDSPHWSHDWLIHDSAGKPEWYWCWGNDFRGDLGYGVDVVEDPLGPL